MTYELFQAATMYTTNWMSESYDSYVIYELKIGKHVMDACIHSLGGWLSKCLSNNL